jgi:predicted ATPase
MEPLARLIADASRYSQIWVTTHSRDLANFIEELTGYAPIELEKVDGETRIIGAKSIPTDDDDDD